MANRDYKNIKRFVDNLSKEVEDVMENGGGSGGMYEIEIHSTGDNYNNVLKTFVDKPNLTTYEDMMNYLISKGCHTAAQEVKIYMTSGRYENKIIKGILVSDNLPGMTHIIYGSMLDNVNVTVNDNNFRIVYLEQE